MAQATGNQICSLCQEDEKTNTAITWCIDCETFLCSDCNKTHGRIKATKDHNMTSVDSYNELPSFITETKNHCQEHNKRLEIYCSFHSEACCLECITTTHNECKGFRKIEDVLSDFKSSSSVFHAETYLNDLSANFEKVTTHLTKQLAAIGSQKTNGVQNIESTKRSLVDHLDKIAKCLVDDVELKYSDIKSAIENKIIEIGRQKSELDQAKREFSKMMEFATDIQMYEGIKVIEKTTNEKTQYLEELERKGEMNETRLEIKLSPFLNSIISDLVCFGDASVLLTSSSVVLNLNKGEQVNILSRSRKKNIDDIRPKLLKIIQILDGKNVNVPGCRILPDGRMVFVEQNRKCLLLYSKDGELVRTVTKFANAPYDVTFVKDNVVAVTTYIDKRVNFVNIDENKIIKSCEVEHSCYGIAKDNETLRTNNTAAKGIINLDLDGKVISSFQINSKCSTNIAIFQDQLYFSEWRDDKVSSCKNNGNCLWTHQLSSRSEPRGLSLDKYGNIYVACVQSNNVIIISEDGKTHSNILNESNGLKKPFGLHIDNKMSKLLVSNHTEGSACLFQI